LISRGSERNFAPKQCLYPQQDKALNKYQFVTEDQRPIRKKKFAECDNIFLAKFQSQFDSLYLSLS